MTRLGLFLVVLILVSAISVVGARHEARKLFQALQQEQKRGRDLEIQWESFLTEQGSWGMHGRVEVIVNQQMRMKVPEADRIRVLAPVAGGKP